MTLFGGVASLYCQAQLNDGEICELAEIIVVVRSVGTGSYLSAHAFSIDEDQTLILLASVEGLQSTADPLAALMKMTLPGIIE